MRAIYFLLSLLIKFLIINCRFILAMPVHVIFGKILAHDCITYFSLQTYFYTTVKFSQKLDLFAS